EPRGLPARGVVQELEQPSLADAVLTDDEQCLATPVVERVDRSAEGGYLLFPSDERSRRTRPCRLLGGEEPPRLDLGLATSHRHESQRFESEATAEILRRPWADEDRSGLCLGLQ